jgi:vitamin-K-epoxide reductase (warfarin-sensitive)
MSKAIINTIALVGVVVASYALYIESTHASSKAAGLEVTFFCDNIVSWASCSAALTGPYGHILSQWGLVPKGSTLDQPNALIGLGFYVLALLPWHTSRSRTDAFLAASTASLAFSLYLAYVLRFVIHEFCIICVTSYSINVAIFVLAARMSLRGDCSPQSGKEKGAKGQ